mmetsp:Transcript_10314/g.11514  ORF Transcript_10314/g.11514 Transcript_10314/m.11514 type:complete len:1058 (+) Transcript_10314:67-3240(+)
MLSYTTTTQPLSRPAIPWKSTMKTKDEVQLSKSLGDIPLLGLLSRASSEIISIKHSGYLLKRSNAPVASVNSLVSDDVDNNEGNSENDAPPNPHRRTPQHIESIPLMYFDEKRDHDEAVSLQKKESRNKELVEKSSDMLASFFGIQDDSASEENEETPIIRDETYPSDFSNFTARFTPPTVLYNPIGRSSPISFRMNNFSDEGALHRSASSSCDDCLSSPPPPDIVDAKDGHIWRAKYCVLEDGILYFYRNAIEGETLEAQFERDKTTASTENGQRPIADDLSKSPQVGRRLVAGGIDNTNNNLAVWEKRVALDLVGAVRSTELEHGDFSLELVASSGEEDRLVLRARNSTELNEWLFKFHCSLASFMKNMVDAMGEESCRTRALDLHNVAPPIVFSPSMDSSLLLRNRKTAVVQRNSLSHGHGRNGLHRRRASEEVGRGRSLDSSPIQFNLDHSLKNLPRKIPSIEGQRENSSSKYSTPEMSSQGYLPKSEQQPYTPPLKYVPPHMRKKSLDQRKKGKIYIPPSLRIMEDRGERKLTLAERASLAPQIQSTVKTLQSSLEGKESILKSNEESHSEYTSFQLGGCADPKVAIGSIMDECYKKRKSSKIGKVPAESYGSYGGGIKLSQNPSLRWEVGAVSECGVRDSNEDSFLICSSASNAFRSLSQYQENPNNKQNGKHDPAFFAIFDGHCGNEAARFSAERLNEYLYDEWNTSDMDSAEIKNALRNAIKKIDDDFCRICMEDGRNWESGSTAIVAAIIDEELIVASLGDCRAVACRSTGLQEEKAVEHALQKDGWGHVEFTETMDVQRKKKVTLEPNIHNKYFREWYWKEVADVHNPARADEKARIEDANGWITSEKEIPIGQLRRMDFCDEDVVEILKRCFSGRYNQAEIIPLQKRCNAAPQRIIQIFRICGELSVSRAIGDRDFKAGFNKPRNESDIRSDTFSNGFWWYCPLPLPYPENHNNQFKGDLVTSVAESRSMKLLNNKVVDEFLVLGCDGLWDVMDPDDVVRVTCGLLFEKKWPARKVAARLTELAVHLGSSDNITIVVIRFIHGTKK